MVTTDGLSPTNTSLYLLDDDILSICNPKDLANIARDRDLRYIEEIVAVSADPHYHRRHLLPLF
jgi:hypothetical protein